MIDSPLLGNAAGYIDGRWTAGAADATFAITNPVDGSVLGELPGMGAADVEQAVSAAHGALQRPADLETRRAWLQGITDALHEHKEEIARVLTLEHGKPWPEAQGEVLYAAGFFAFCARGIDALAPRVLEERPRDCTWTVHQRPAGVAALITPWNFPIGMIAKKLSAALAADAPCVIKPSSKTPLTMVALFDLLDRVVGLPPGKANLVTGDAGTISDALMADPRVRVVSFTGSTAVGRRLIEAGAPDIKRLTLELGGNAPFIVFADADLDDAADQLIANKFRGGGQTCVCANRVLVEARAVEAFSEKVAERAGRLRLGNGLEEGVDLGPLIDRSGYDKVRRHLRDALEHGAELVLGDDPGPLAADFGAFFPPAVVRGVTREMACSREETFGPLVPIMAFEGDDEALEMANDTEFGLAAYLFTADDVRAERLIAGLEFSHVGWNTGSGPTPEAPFGGRKHSGYGREGGVEGLFEFVEPQTVPRGR